MTNLYKVNGCKKINGEMDVSGSKNASFPMLAAMLRISGEIIYHNLPSIKDISIMIAILEVLGVKRKITGFNLTMFSIPTEVDSKIPYELGSKIRGGMYLVGALLARNKYVDIPYPGGCQIGDRGIDLHISALNSMGVQYKYKEKSIYMWCDKLHGCEINLPYPSRGVTGNIMLAATAAEGETIIHNANTSPEILELGDVLKKMGFEIQGLGTKTIRIKGRTEIINVNDMNIKIPGDKIEIGTLAIAALITKGEICLYNARKRDIFEFAEVIKNMGGEVLFQEEKDAVKFKYISTLRCTDVLSGLPPKIDPDFEPLIAALMTQCVGKGVIEDKINPARHNNFLPQFEKSGVLIEYIDMNKAVIYGESQYTTNQVLEGKDLRSCAAVLLLALGMEGVNYIEDLNQLCRGYENLIEKLNQLGAEIEEVNLDVLR